MSAKKRHNPCYVLLVPVGIAFVVTAFAYYVMAFQAIRPLSADGADSRSHPLFLWLRANGATAMLVELTGLGVLTVAAFAIDRFWDRSDATNSTNRPLG